MGNYRTKSILKFKFISWFYDAFDWAFALDQSRNPRRRLAQRIPNGTVQILDVCVGTANSAIAVAKNRPDVHITGIDLSADMMAVARRKTQKLGISNINFRQMDATNMDFPDDSFDVVMVSFGLHELSYVLMIKVLTEMNRVLNRNGKLYVIDYEREDDPVRRVLLWLCLKLFEPKHMSKFLEYSWDDIFRESGFKLDASEKLLFSKLISGTK